MSGFRKKEMYVILIYILSIGDDAEDLSFKKGDIVEVVEYGKLFCYLYIHININFIIDNLIIN